jgi:hypothetical protein
MEHRGGADAGPEVLGIGGDGEQRLGRGADEDAALGSLGREALGGERLSIEFEGLRWISLVALFMVLRQQRHLVLHLGAGDQMRIQPVNTNGRHHRLDGAHGRRGSVETTAFTDRQVAEEVDT